MTSVIRAAKIQYYKKTMCLNRNNIKKTWNVLKELMQQNCSKSNLIDFLNIDGEEITDECDIAENFNKYFSNVAVDLDAQMEPSNINPMQYINRNMVNSLFLSPVTVKECIGIVSKLKNTKYNNSSLPVFIFKQSIRILAQHIVKLINNSFITGIFPQCLKCATITPIYKKDDKHSISNYRPISVLPLMSKVFERCVASRLWSYFNKHSIISVDQFGFQRGKSTLDALEALTERVYSSLNSKEHAACIFVDLRKAFDTVNHAILLRKLECYGIRGLPLQWFTSYLCNRTQCVKIGSKVSNLRTVNISVPQGSILGPILFLCYVNDLPNACPNLSTLLYADDTTLTATHTDYHSLIKLINSELDSFKYWAISNRLSINSDKTVALLITNRLKHVITPLLISLASNFVGFENYSKFLGVEIDRSLSFENHIRNIRYKISRVIGVLNKLKDYLNENQMINLYYSLIYPYLTYGNEIWGGSFDILVSSIFLMQKRIVRIITNSDYLSHTDPLPPSTRTLKHNTAPPPPTTNIKVQIAPLGIHYNTHINGK